MAIAIDNSTRSAPAAFNDQDSLEIARRIERDSGSNYRINGREVRARDVQILFARRLHRRALAGAWCIRAASARSSRPSPNSAAACWKMLLVLLGLHAPPA
mgnify:CR=1 FL=1